MDLTDKRLLERLQREFPIVERPYSALAGELALSEQEVIARVQALKETGIIRAVAAVIEPAQLGMKGALVAVKVDLKRLEEVAALASSFPEVTHNYGREDEFNLWFTVVAASQARLEQIVRKVEQAEGVEQIALLPTERKFKLQVQFNLENGASE